MDRAYIDQHHVVERYLRGTLTPEDLSGFELYMLEHPEIVNDVEYARGLGDAMIAAKSELLGTEDATKRQPSFFLGPRYAMAATVVLALTSASSVYLLERNAALSSEMDRLSAPSLAPTEVWLENMRGGEPPVVEKSPKETLVLRVATDPATQGPYEIRIRSADNGFSWIEAPVFADGENSLRIVARDLPVGTYEVTATSAPPNRATVAYRFRLVAAD